MLKQLIKSILLLCAVALPVWIAVRVAINVYRSRRRQQISKARELWLAILFLYLVCLAAVTVAPLPIAGVRRPQTEGVNLVPVRNSLKCLPSRQAGRHESLLFCLENVAGNIILFLPLGFLLPLIYGQFASIKAVLLAGLLLSLSIEAIQFFSRFVGIYRSVDIDDVLLNTLGAVLGYLCLLGLRRLRRI